MGPTEFMVWLDGYLLGLSASRDTLSKEHVAMIRRRLATAMEHLHGCCQDAMAATRQPEAIREPTPTFRLPAGELERVTAMATSRMPESFPGGHVPGTWE